MAVANKKYFVIGVVKKHISLHQQSECTETKTNHFLNYVYSFKYSQFVEH